MLLVDYHGVVRQGVKLYLEHDASVEVVGEAANGREALERVEELAPHVVVMDLVMPVMDGVEATREIKRRFPDVEVVALTSVLEDRKVVDAVRAGATGYLLKDADAGALSVAIHAAARGEVHLHPEAAKRLAREMQAASLREPLTARELEVLRHVARGESNKAIARALDVEERTVKAHVTSLLAKLGLASRTQAALYAVREGLA